MGGGGKGGGGGHTPIEKPNTLESAQKLKIIDLLCEGVAGTDVTFKNIYLDNTPIQNSDGSYNFTGIRVSALPGTHNQDYLAGFDSTDKIVSVGAEVKAATPITRTITDPLVDSVRVTIALGSLVTMTDKGDRVGGSVSLTVMCGNKSYPVTISGKTTSAYHQDVTLTDLPDAPFNISVHRNTPDSATDKVSNATHWVSYVESIDAKFNYPNSVVVGLEIDSAQFGGKIPARTYLNKWTQIKVPSNYNPITRTYEGIWLGEFKTAWSNNPAWVFYDVVTDKRYGMGDRLGEFGCDKWSLYQIAKYCDQIVPDGFGGQEPRFTCNAYLSEPRDAKALLDDLASVFRGIAVWDGQMVTALQDAKKDPTATYSNSNVVDGMFAYSGAAQKTIFTAVHVKYNDKTDNYATKTEYVADDDAIKRYGLNVKQITAFGCTSRGQAARIGKWLIETSIRERQMVSFSVGREGIRHLPFDIIEIADNDYAGDMIGGRVLSVTGNTITVDRTMSDVSSIRYYADGQSKTVSVIAIQDNKITLSDTPVGIKQLGVFSATKTGVKPRLFRALSIKEDDGTYTISAVQHDENKEAIVDQGATFEQDDTATKHKPQVSYGRVSKDGDELVLSWEGTNTTQYLIKIYKDGELYNSYTQDTAEIKLKGLSNGDYRAEIRGRSANGELTEAVIKEWSIDYDIKGLKATPELFAIKLDWTNPTTVINKAKIEIYRSQTADRATATKVATLSYPTDTFTQNGVKLTETHHFWLRLIDDQGNTGNWVTVSGQCSSDTSQIVASINGKVTQTELAQSLIDSLQNDIDTAKGQAVGTAGVDAANKVAAEATARANAIQAEATARQQALAAQDTKQTNALTAKAQELGTQISDVSDVNNQQAQKLTTITAKQGELTSGLEIERTARIAGDAAEATARQTLASQVGGNKTSITDLQSTKASKTEVSSLARSALQSEWQDAANTAKSQAISAAAVDAKAKADAALAAAKTDAQTKADAAKAAAQTYATQQVNAKSVTDKAYADGLVTAEEQRAINDANAKLAAAKTDATTKANAAELAAKNHAELKIGEIEIGGRNLLPYSSIYHYAGGYLLPKVGNIYTITDDEYIQATEQPLNSVLMGYEISGVYESLTISGKTDLSSVIVFYRAMKADGTILIAQTAFTISVINGYFEAIFPAMPLGTSKLNIGIGNDSISNYKIQPKLEKGNIATDWTPAPEDVDAAIDVVSSELTEFKQTTASKDSAQTIVNNQALSRINSAESSITSLQSTKASKTEVSSLARTALQSEWQDAANTAKTDAISAAATDAQAKADAALASAKTDAQTKADAAKAAAQTYATQQVAAKSVTDKAYADGLVTAEEQRAINDANAKLAAAKADAQTKADAAEVAAKAHADLKVESIEIGGRNLVIQKEITPNYHLRHQGELIPETSTKSGVTGFIPVVGGAEYTFSKPDNDVISGHVVAFSDKDKRPIGGINIGYGINSQVTIAIPIAASFLRYSAAFNQIANYETWQLERGNKATDWTPAPEDVDAAIDVVSSELTSFKETTASKDSAQTIVNNQALSRINTAEGKITTLQNTSVTKDKAQSTHTIKTQAIAGGKRAIAGIAVGAMANETTAESQVIVMADKFGVVKNAADGVVKPMLTVVNNQVAVNGDLIADGTILGKHIKANQTITAPVINGGSLNINNQFKVDKFGNLTAKSGTFEGTVLADKINGFIGIESMKRSAWLPSWAVYIETSDFVTKPSDFSRDFPITHASRGSIDFMWGGTVVNAAAMLMFEMHVTCKHATTPIQKIHRSVGSVTLYVNGSVVAYTNRSAVEIPLQQGENVIQYVVRDTNYNTGIGVVIGGNFVDNDIIKFT